MNLVKEFKEFVSKGNFIDLAIAVVIGGAVAAVINSLVNNVIMPIVAIPFGKPNFDDVMILTINDAQIKLGAFFTTVVSFILIAIVLFAILKAYNTFRHSPDAGPSEIDLLTEIRDELRRQSPK